MPDLTFDQMTDEEYAPYQAAVLDGLGNLLIAHFDGKIPAGLDFDAECDELAKALGLIPDPDVQAREPRGHLRGVRGRAVPTFDKRRGAVGA